MKQKQNYLKTAKEFKPLIAAYQEKNRRRGVCRQTVNIAASHYKMIIWYMENVCKSFRGEVVATYDREQLKISYPNGGGKFALDDCDIAVLIPEIWKIAAKYDCQVCCLIRYWMAA